jgi:hypothetical protein
MLPVLLVIDERGAVDVGIRGLEPGHDHQGQQVQRPESRYAGQPEAAHRRAVGKIDMGKDKARHRPEILHRHVAIVEQPAQRMIERDHRRAVDLEAIAHRRHEEVLIMPEQHEERGNHPRQVKRVEMPLGQAQAR